MEKTREKLDEYEIVDKKEKELDEIVIYRDIDDIGRVFVSKAVLKRFHILKPVYKLVLETQEELYEISPKEAVYIIENANNPYAPYTIRYQNFDFKNELEDDAQKKSSTKATDIINIFRDIDNSERAFVTIDVIRRFNLNVPHHKVIIGDIVVYEIDSVDAINIINNSNNKIAPYQIHYINIEFEKTPDKIMPYIETRKNKTQALKRPRRRRPNESDETYVAYLEGFYDALFGYTEEDEKESRVKPYKKKTPDAKTVADTKVGASDDAYVKYLKDYYHRMFNQETLEKVQPRNLIKQRPRRPDESDVEYQQYLSMFYKPIIKEEQTRRAK